MSELLLLRTVRAPTDPRERFARQFFRVVNPRALSFSTAEASGTTPWWAR
jgi:hypothetical protein